MPISQQIGSSSLAKPGVCTSATRPASPYEGQMIYETDTDRVLVWTGTAWYPAWNRAWGKVTFNEVISNSAAITSEATQITADSFTFISGRLYKVTYFEPQFYVTSGTPAWIALRIKDGATTLNIAYFSPSGTGTQDVLINHSWVGQLSGTKSLTATAQVNTGTVVAGRGATQRAYLLVEDIGPA